MFMFRLAMHSYSLPQTIKPMWKAHGFPFGKWSKRIRLQAKLERGAQRENEVWVSEPPAIKHGDRTSNSRTVPQLMISQPETSICINLCWSFYCPVWLPEGNAAWECTLLIPASSKIFKACWWEPIDFASTLTNCVTTMLKPQPVHQPLPVGR